MLGFKDDSCGINQIIKIHSPNHHILEADYWRAVRQAEMEWVRSLIGDLNAGSLTWDRDAIFPALRGDPVSSSQAPVESPSQKKRGVSCWLTPLLGSIKDRLELFGDYFTAAAADQAGNAADAGGLVNEANRAISHQTVDAA